MRDKFNSRMNTLQTHGLESALLAQSLFYKPPSPLLHFSSPRVLHTHILVLLSLQEVLGQKTLQQVKKGPIFLVV
jgi:hypothetical protein